MEFEETPGGTVIVGLTEAIHKAAAALIGESEVSVKCQKCEDEQSPWVCVECYQSLEARLYAANLEKSEMIKAAGECLGTDEELRGTACVFALVNHVAWLRNQLSDKYG
jgi:hypothetical protein